jgi:hypothetical protein
MWNNMNNIIVEDQPEPDDIVGKLIQADKEQRRMLEGAMIIGDHIGKSLFLEAAEEIQKLRRVLNITEN